MEVLQTSALPLGYAAAVSHSTNLLGKVQSLSEKNQKFDRDRHQPGQFRAIVGTSDQLNPSHVKTSTDIPTHRFGAKSKTKILKKYEKRLRVKLDFKP